MCGSSDDWVPDPEREPAAAPPVAFASGPFQPRVPDAEAVADRPTLAASPWTWASLGGVVVALTFSAVFFLNRPRPAQAVGRATSPASASITRASTATPAAVALAAADAVKPGPVTTDLLPLVNLKRDVIAGSWRIANGALMSDGSARARVGFRLSLPREYDFRVQFTQVDGNNCVSQIFTSQNSGSLVLGGWKRKFTGFQQIRGRWADNPQNPTRLAGLKFENGRMHTSVVKVRKGSIEAWLDGKRIASYATDGSDLSNMDWGVQGYPLGIGSELSSTIFHKVELIEGADDVASQ
jgi:hypothetical protein